MLYSKHDDEGYMRHALSLARRGVGLTAENPSVGCVIIKAGRVIGAGFTARGGRPHAEVVALKQAGALAKGACVYVTLEPCSHQGQTASCAETLIRAGVVRVVVACLDPDCRVNGKGIAMLRAAGLTVDLGILRQEAESIHKPFFTRVGKNRPFVSLKIAQSIDGRVALSGGESQWITQSNARAYGHKLRSEADAIMVGSGTVLADNPSLTCRLAGLEKASPHRIILDRRGRLSPKQTVFDGLVPTCYYGSSSDIARLESITAIGDKSDLASILTDLAQRGYSQLLVEGGAELATSLLEQDFVDCLYIFSAGIFLGSDARAAVSDLNLDDLSLAKRFDLKKLQRTGPDYLAHWVRKR